MSRLSANFADLVLIYSFLVLLSLFSRSSARASRAPIKRGRFGPVKFPRHAVEKSRPLSRVLSWTVIPLGYASPRTSSDLPGSLVWATHMTLPYLALLQVGFAMPLMLPPARCALTAPFHPYRHRLRGT